MSIYIRKSKLIQNLATQEYYIRDTSATSPSYFEIVSFPEKIGGGKSLIVLKGSSTNLRVGSGIDVEVLDANGNPLYYEISNLIDRFNQYHISISVYDITAQGIGTVYITGEASVDPNGDLIPSTWQNRPNIIWSKNINIQPYERNDSKIVFSDPPQISIAQVILPQRAPSGSLVKGLYTTASAANIFSIVTSDFKGFDKQIAQDNGIADLDKQRTSVNPTQQPKTINSVDTTLRSEIANSSNAYKINKIGRFNTIVRSTQPFFSASYLGAIFQISGSPVLYPDPTLATVSGSAIDQVQKYQGTIVEVINSTTAVLDTPISVKALTQQTTKIASREVDWIYKLVTGSFIGVVTYGTTTPQYVTSSNISQNYVEFTYNDLNPIAGQVYKIRPFFKLSGRTGDYKLLTDQFVKPIEYLADPTYGNQTTYGQSITDYYLVGHFIESESLNRYWSSYRETQAGVGSDTLPQVDNTVQAASVQLSYSESYSRLLTTNFYQNYIGDRGYTTTMYLTLDPRSELEVYANSEPLQQNYVTQVSYPIAFDKSANLERTRYTSAYSRFGKFVGKITNNTDSVVNYGKVGFDFLPDRDGLGKPLFRVKSVDYTNTGSAYLSQISVAATALNGFTPNLVQFAVPFDQFPQTSLSQSVDFKLEYFDYTGNQSEYVTFINGVKLNERSIVNSTGCQQEQYSWTFDSPYYHMATQSYYETGSNSGFASQSLWPYAYTGSVNGIFTAPTTYTTQYSASNLFTSVDLIASSSNVNLKYWPSIEWISGMYLLPTTMSNNRLILTSNITNGHWRTSYNIPVFADGYKIWGIKYSNSDISLWNIKRPIFIDTNNNSLGYTNPLYDSSDTILSTAAKNLYISGTIPIDPIGMAWIDVGATVQTGSLTIAHTNDYPPYDAQADGYTDVTTGVQSNYPYWDGSNHYRQPTWKFGNMQGKITSSWNWVSKVTENFGTYNTPEIVPSTGAPSNAYYQFTNPQTQPDYLGKYLAETSSAFYSRSLQTSSIDNRWLVYEGSVGITRNMVSASYRDFNNAITDAQRTYALKQRRLMFPMNGSATSSFFTQNGGIYSVSLKIKQTGSYTPDTGSYIDIYIFNANADYTSSVAGVGGWRPPTNNIVTIGNGFGLAPTLTNYDPATGGYYNQYDFTLVQYGTPAQIVIEPGGVTGSEAYFGTLIDDISICKIGVTTDPNYIAPTSLIANFNTITSVPVSPTQVSTIAVVDGQTYG